VGKLDKPTLAGVALCAVPVAAFSAWSQFETAKMAGVPGALAWVFPMATDATAFVATRIWLDDRFAPGLKADRDDPTEQRKRGVRRYAAGLAMAAILLSVGGAAAHLALQGVAVPFWLQLSIGGLPSFALAGLVHLAAIIAAASIPSRPAKAKKAPKTVGTVEARPPTSTVPAPKSASGTGSALHRGPDTASSIASPEIGKGSLRDRMLAYLDRHGEVTGAELDRMFNAKNYGRGVVRAWKKAHDLPKVSGE
jgi:hypothetical protein